MSLSGTNVVRNDGLSFLMSLPGKLVCEIPLIISNHEDLRNIASQFGIPFYHIAIDKTNKIKAETRKGKEGKESVLEKIK